MRSNTKHYTVLIGIVLIVLLAVGYLIYEQIQLNHRNEIRPTQVTSAMSGTDTIKGDDTANETTKNSLDGYTVAADAPRALYIEALNIAARIMPMGVTANNSIQAPKNIYDAGWYTASAKPGHVGALFIDGHASGATRMGLFAYLDTLKRGDTLVIEKGSGEKLTYVVRATETIPEGSVDMNKVLAPYTPGTSGVNLMTCTGEWVADRKTYTDRVIVYTEQV